MNAIHTEILYLQRRLDDTMAMAKAAAGPCSRKSHETLARLYGEALEALSVHASSLVAAPLVAFAARTARVAPRTVRPVPTRARLTLKLAS